MYSGNGDGEGNDTGFKYSGKLSKSELASVDQKICANDEGDLKPGDTIELHYVHSSAQVKPGPTLAACVSESIKNPQLRVEAQVFVLVNDATASDFAKLTAYAEKDGLQQALNIPTTTDQPVLYAGSTTGPAFNEAGSPLQVTWVVRPKVAKVNIASVGKWCEANVFDESGAHGVRNLVKNPALLSPIE